MEEESGIAYPCGTAFRFHRQPGVSSMLDIGRKLQDLREAHGLSQRALARRAGISNALISLIEKEKTSPSVASLKKILDSFPVELSDFFAPRPDAPPKTGAPRK